MYWYRSICFCSGVVYVKRKRIARNAAEQPGGIFVSLTPLEALNKPRWTQTVLCGASPRYGSRYQTLTLHHTVLCTSSSQLLW